MKTVKRRRKENRTDYLNRLNLLKSGKPRIVFRKTNRYLISQYVVSSESQDKIILGTSTKELLKNGWPENGKNSLKNLPAAYFLGFLMGKKIQKQKLGNPIVDFGMLRTIHKTKPYSFLKGLIDSGLKINCKKEALPEEERIKGKHLKSDFSQTFEKIKLNLEKV